MADIEQALRSAMTNSAFTPYGPTAPNNNRVSTPNMEWPSPPSVDVIKNALQHPAARVVGVFIVAFIILVIVNPPFVNVHDDEPRNPIEEPPCSYGRVMVSAAIFAALVVVVPLCIQHRSKFNTAYVRIKQLADKAQSTFPSSLTSSQPKQ